MADGNLFLVEELENDIHPEGLKAILDVIVEKSSSSQFIVSTHSNIVTKYLGSAPGAKVSKASSRSCLVVSSRSEFCEYETVLLTYWLQWLAKPELSAAM
jgi:predicted ATP-dependent endonuclease of OLD family